MHSKIKRKYYQRDYKYKLNNELYDMLSVICSMRQLIDKSYIRSAINIARYQRVFGDLTAEKYNAIKKIAVFCGYYG